MKKTYEAVLFDLGNVVLHIHFDRVFQSWAKSAKKSTEAVTKAFVFDEMYAAHEVAQIDGTKYHSHVCSLIGAQIPYQDFVTGWNSIFGEAIVETVALIHDLKPHYRLFALTNSNVLHREVWSVTHKEALQDIERIFCSSLLGLRKPDAKAFAKICSETEIPKERFVFVDDLAENIAGAEKFGMKSVLFSEPKASTEIIRKLLLS
jgi:FMN phosphatase YigB (HAD superfamily)